MVFLSLATLPDDSYMMTILISDELLFFEIDTNNLQLGWNSFPHIATNNTVGDTFASECGYCFLKIPLAVTKGDYNYIINPHHDDFANISIITQ